MARYLSLFLSLTKEMLIRVVQAGIKAPLKEIYLDFMGSKLLITRDAESGEGKVKEEDIPFVSGTTLKFVAEVEGEEAWKEEGVRFLDIKVCPFLFTRYLV